MLDADADDDAAGAIRLLASTYVLESDGDGRGRDREQNSKNQAPHSVSRCAVMLSQSNTAQNYGYAKSTPSKASPSTLNFGQILFLSI